MERGKVWPRFAKSKEGTPKIKVPLLPGSRMRGVRGEEKADFERVGGPSEEGPTPEGVHLLGAEEETVVVAPHHFVKRAGDGESLEERLQRLPQKWCP